jgi:hypothetical protein
MNGEWELSMAMNVLTLIHHLNSNKEQLHSKNVFYHLDQYLLTPFVKNVKIKNVTWCFVRV